MIDIPPLQAYKLLLSQQQYLRDQYILLSIQVVCVLCVCVCVASYTQQSKHVSHPQANVAKRSSVQLVNWGEEYMGTRLL